jgi:hypothetical protein
MRPGYQQPDRRACSDNLFSPSQQVRSAKALQQQDSTRMQPALSTDTAVPAASKICLENSIWQYEDAAIQ